MGNLSEELAGLLDITNTHYRNKSLLLMSQYRISITDGSAWHQYSVSCSTLGRLVITWIIVEMVPFFSLFWETPRH